MPKRASRDQYKKVLYAAEDQFMLQHSPGRTFDSIQDAQSWVHLVQSVDPLLEDIPWVSVRPAHGNVKASRAYFEENALSMVDCHLNEQVILHELAHLATGRGYPHHGREFCWNYLDLTLRWRGANVYLELRNAIRDKGII